MRLTLCGSAKLAVGAPDDATHVAAKSLALLAFLTLEPGKHTRDELSSLLWGDSSDEKAHASLRQALKQLRGVLGEHLEVDRQTVSLRGTLPNDVSEFLAHAAQGNDHAADFDIPRFLAGLVVRDAPAFEEWAEGTRRSLMQQFRRSLTAAARAAHARRDWPRALELAGRWRRLDPLSDDAAHFHVEVLYLKGERDAALAAFRDFRALREEEHGSAPGLALRELAARIEDAPSTPTPLRLPAVRGAPLPAFDVELIGREREWEMLQQTWSRLSGGHGGIVFVEGASGVGKSRLIDDFARFVATQEAVVLRGRAFESGLEAPFGPVLQILRGAVDAPGAGGTDGAWLAEVARVVPEMRRSFPSLPEPSRAPTADGSLLHEGVAQLLLAVAEESRVVIVLDDLQWCDADSCNLLHFLVQRLRDQAVLWCVTVTPGAAERDAPAARLARALRASSQTARLRLETLSRDDVWQLIRALGRVSHPEGAVRLAARVHEVTGGNPLYVVELLKTLFARGWLTVHPDTLEWTTTDTGASELNAGELNASELFPGVRESLGERIAALPDEQHALLLTIAATGSGCHTSLLSYVHGISRLRAAHLCDALVERGLLMETGGHYLCAHTVIAGVAVESMSTSRRREVHRMIALALSEAASSIGSSADPGSIARHAEAGGERAMAHRHALMASAVCVARSAWDDALLWLDLASSCADTPDEIAAADRATAALLGGAGWSAAPEPRPGFRPTPHIGRGDVDLTPDGPVDLPS